MPGKKPDWNAENIVEAARAVTERYYNGELQNRWQIETEFHKITGYNPRFSTIMKYAKGVK
jgi:single-stranded DNA-binding protein